MELSKTFATRYDKEKVWSLESELSASKSRGLGAESPGFSVFFMF